MSRVFLLLTKVLRPKELTPTPSEVQLGQGAVYFFEWSPLRNSYHEGSIEFCPPRRLKLVFILQWTLKSESCLLGEIEKFRNETLRKMSFSDFAHRWVNTWSIPRSSYWGKLGFSTFATRRIGRLPLPVNSPFISSKRRISLSWYERDEIRTKLYWYTTLKLTTLLRYMSYSSLFKVPSD